MCTAFERARRHVGVAVLQKLHKISKANKNPNQR